MYSLLFFSLKVYLTSGWLISTIPKSTKNWRQEISSPFSLNERLSKGTHNETVELPATNYQNNKAGMLEKENLFANSSSWLDEEFEAWVASKLVEDSDPSLLQKYPELLSNIGPKCITNWRRRYRGNPKLWRRVFRPERVFKEFIEAVPIIDAVREFIINAEESEKFTILDLASGKGYLSMLLSELLPVDRVNKIVLIDKAWPMCGSEPKDHHINWDHIYGNVTNICTDKEGSIKEVKQMLVDSTEGHYNGNTYFSTWPIPLHTSKQDLKQKSVQRQLKKRLFEAADMGTIIILAIHLCGTLSLKAVDMFNDNPSTVGFFALKPCCLPGIVHSQRDEIFATKGSDHTFAANLVCAPGRWGKNRKWYGPPRWHLEKRFHVWADNLFRSINTEDKVQTEIMIQQDGGYQNTFLFAKRKL